MALPSSEHAFPRLDPDELALLRPLATPQVASDGEVVFRAGDRDIDFFVVEAGWLAILNPTADDRPVTLHGPGEFAGDIDLLTRRPVIVTAVARETPTRLLRVPGRELRRLLNTIPPLAEKLLVAFRVRRAMLQQAGVLGLRVAGGAQCPETTVLREFLFRNFVPYTWYDSETPEGLELVRALGGLTPDDTPLVETAPGRVLARPSLRALAEAAGLARRAPDRVFDLAVVGAGPAGLTAAIYGASEGVSTVVLDALGPGGQAAGSSLIENFVGFPSGLSGGELAMRGALQMLKFGATLLCPVRVERLVPGAEHHVLVTGDGQEVRARHVLVASGARWRPFTAGNARRFERAGVYYSATCVEQRACEAGDLAVVGGGNSAGQAAMFLAESARRVHLVIRGAALEQRMSAYLAGRIAGNPRIEVHPRSEIEDIGGAERIEAIRIVDRVSREARTVPCTAVFVFIGADPNTAWLPDEVARDRRGYVLTGEDARRARAWPLERAPRVLETSLPRVFAAGDVRAGAARRVAGAVGDGAMAITGLHQID